MGIIKLKKIDKFYKFAFLNKMCYNNKRLKNSKGEHYENRHTDQAQNIV